ncbi:LCP family protein [Streptomyces sp. BYX5S]
MLAAGLVAVSGTVIGQAVPTAAQQADVLPGVHGRPQDGNGTNILLLGTDGRDTITPAEKKKFYAGGTACNCSDSMMLIHLSQRRDRLSVVGLPRDSYAQIPELAEDGTVRNTHPAKINAAYAQGGPALAVRTVESATGVRIDHFLQIDFRRFIDSVNAVDGVTVCTERSLSDRTTKLNLAPGQHRLKGGGALQYVRSRHLDASADLGRIQRQQRFLVNALRGTGTRDLLSQPLKAAGLARTVLGPDTVEQGIGVKDLVSLAHDLRGIPLKQTEFTTVPASGFNPLIPDVGSTLRWDQDKTEELFTRLRQDQPLTRPGTNTALMDPPKMSAPTVVPGSKLACSP